MIILTLILFTVLLNTTAQLLLKAGMARIGYFAFDWQHFGVIAVQILSNALIWGGLFSYLISVIIWLLVLSRAEVSYAYPLSTSLAYVITAVAGYLLFQERLSEIRIIGIGTVLLGVYLISRS